MDRQIVYPGQIPQDTDILSGQLNPYIAISKLSVALFGSATQINAFTCIPTISPSLNVIVTPGEIYKLAAIDTSAYGTLPTNSHQILKQGILLDNTANIPCAAPVTVGNSINYLIEISFTETDGGSTLLPYYNAANPSQAWAGPNNDALPQNTVRYDGVTVQAKAGTSAPTGTQTTPSPDSGFVGAFVVTVAHGQTTINTGDISTYSGAPFIDIPSGGLAGAIQSNQYLYAADTSVSANTVTASINPAITSLTTGMTVYVKIANTNTGASTFNLNGLGAKNIQRLGGQALIGGELAVNRISQLTYDGTQFELTTSANESLQAVTDSGSVNAYAATLTPTPIAYFTNQRLILKIANTNTSTACTLNLNSLGTKSIKLTDGGNPYVGSLQNGGEYILIYDGTNFQLLNPTPSIAQQNNVYTYATDTGTANVYAIAPAPAITAYTAGQSFLVNIAHTNTGTSGSTINVSSLGTKNIVTATSTTLIAGQLIVGMIARIVYNGTSFLLENPAPVSEQVTILTSGSGTYTTPVGAVTLVVEGVGGGGGGGGSGTTTVAGTAGNNTTFGSAFLTANGGSASSGFTPGPGGTATGGDINITGGSAGGGGQDPTTISGAIQTPGGVGGASFFGGAGAAGAIGAGAGGNASTNSGAGGGGGGTANTSNVVAGGGGGAGGYFKKTIITANILTSYSYAIGASANGGTAGTSGVAGGNGASGILIITAKFQ